MSITLPVPGGGGSTAPKTYYPGTNHGEYQFIYIAEIINNFQAAYVGEGKILQNVLRGDVTFHAYRALQELHYDTFKSFKSQEIEIPPSLVMALPHDYVNYVKLATVDASGVEHIIYPTNKTSNPFAIDQVTVDGTDGNVGDYKYDTDNIDGIGAVTDLLRQHTTTPIIDTGVSVTSGSNIIILTAADPLILPGMIVSSGLTIGISPNTHVVDNDGAGNITISNNATTTATISITFTSPIPGSNSWENYKGASGGGTSIDGSLLGRRYGIEPQHAQINGSYYIDNDNGNIHFSSALAGDTIVLKYISDGVSNDNESVVHKFAEEAMYKWIAYGCASARVDIPEGIIQRLKKEKAAETRKAKLRLSIIKIEEITQVIRGKSKYIQH